MSDPSVERSDICNGLLLSGRPYIQSPHENIAVPDFVFVIGNHDASDGDDAETRYIRELAFGNALVPLFATCLLYTSDAADE